jgi:hypothetical protein
MSLLDLANVRGFDAHPPSPYACLARAVLANFCTGLSHAHIEIPLARGYFEDVLIRLDGARQMANGDCHVDTVYRVMCEVFESYRDRHFFRRTPRPQAYLEQRGFSFQSHYAFPHWLNNTVPETLVVAPDTAQVLRLCEAMRNPAYWRPGATLAPPSDVLWLTPYADRVRDLVPDPASHSASEGPPKEAANRLREMLGLIRRRPGEHAVAVITRATLRDLLGRQDIGPYAPTIFEARNYERFRHWPPLGADEPGHVGRTYDLNLAARQSVPGGLHGVPEIVTAPLALRDIGEVIYLGTITEVDDLMREPASRNWQAGPGTDDDFADEIAQGQSIGVLLDWLSERLKL